MPFSLSDTIVVVPTAQAGRRLRRSLAARAQTAGTGVLMGPVVTPFRLLEQAGGGTSVDPLAEMATWVDTLSSERCRNSSALFPNVPREIDFAWRQKAAAMLIRVRRQLAESGLTAAEMASLEWLPAGERRRWQDIAVLESIASRMFSDAGLEEPAVGQIRIAAEAPPPSGIRRVVVACCPELAPVLCGMLGRWSSEIEISVLVHAPNGIRDGFDEWGIPKSDYWRGDSAIDLDHGRVLLHVVDGPGDQAEIVRESLARERALAEAGRFAIGAPDDDVVPYTVGVLESMGCPCFDPSGVSHRHHPVYQWLKAWRDLAVLRSYAALRTFIRLAPVGRYIAQKLGVDNDALLNEVDLIQNAGLPETFDDVCDYLEHRRGTYPMAASTIEWLKLELSAPNPGAVDHVLDKLQALNAGYSLVPGRPQDDAFIAVSRALVERLRRVMEIGKSRRGLTDTDWIDLILRESEGDAYYPDARPGAVELEGWLELPWNDAPLMIVTGMNEGFVPDGTSDDLLLPDSARERLGLRCDATRCTRDAYILASLCEVRRNEGSLVLIAGRTSDEGDVLKPSRLFWRCRDDALIARASRFFSAGTRAAAVPERTFNIRLDAAPPDEESKRRCRRSVWSVTDFRSYLNCPFQYYLERVLRMETIDDAKEEMDALDFGKLTHHALEVWGRDETRWNSTDESAIGAYLTDLVSKRVRDLYGRRPPLAVEIQAQSAAQRLQAFARLHVGDIRDGWRIVEVEKHVTFQLGSVEIHGMIDRIDLNERDGRIRVLDYKTTDKAETRPDAAHLRTPREEDGRDYVPVEVTKSGTGGTWMRHWSDLQLPLYLHALKDTYRRSAAIEAGYVQLTRAVSDVCTTMWSGLDGRLVAAAVACAEGVLRDANDGIYWPPLARRYPDTYENLLWPSFIEQFMPPDREDCT